MLLYACAPPAHSSASDRPPIPVTGYGGPVRCTSYPVANTMQSRWCSTPSLVRIPTGLIVAIGQSMSLQLSRCSAG